MKKTAAVLAMTGALSLGVAAPAFAGGNCGYRTSCTSLSNGTLSIFLSSSSTIDNTLSIVVSYKKTGGGTVSARFGRTYNGSNAWGGWFNQSSGTTKSTTWTNGYSVSGCKSAVGLMEVSGQQTFQTPPVTSC
ncbi:hypothetical protein [Streptomyces sp. NPDC090021]|uniref:hypothetical protein n=1 Tax=Streptomyces sp. NPDC090021 TaxID=3365919 RepID=UPI0037FB9ADA